jgi:hypothetical protein
MERGILRDLCVSVVKFIILGFLIMGIVPVFILFP